MTPGAGVLLLGRGHLSEYALSSILSIFSTLIVIGLMDYNAALPCYCWFLFILWWGCRFTCQEVSVKSLILRWSLRPVGVLFCATCNENTSRVHLRCKGSWSLQFPITETVYKQLIFFLFYTLFSVKFLL